MSAMSAYSASASAAFRGLHVGIIMDGNGRWAQAQGHARTYGHRRGADTVRAVVEAAPDCGIGALTLYAFSSDNWKRPRSEVRLLMSLFARYLRRETARCVREGVRLRVIGRRDRLPKGVLRAVERAESATQFGKVLRLRLAVDYSSRAALEEASKLVDADQVSASLAERMARVTHDDLPPLDLDLLVRTGGEQRLSDFLLYEAAYAELLFLPQMWPEFSTDDLATAVSEFHLRTRRFGTVPDAKPPKLVAPSL